MSVENPILCDRKELREAIGRLLTKITRVHQRILELRFALSGGYPYSRDEVARILNCSRERAAALEAVALLRLRDRADALRCFVE